MSVSVTIHLLGGFTLSLAETPITLKLRKAEAMLAYVACARKPVPRDTLADLLWDDRTQTVAQGNLRVALNAAKAALGDKLVVTRQNVALVEGVMVDALAFEAACRAAPAPLTPTTAAALSAALPLYRGDFLHGLSVPSARGFEEWLMLERERLRHLMEEALYALAEHSQHTHDLPASLTWANRLLALDPLRETAHQLKMRVLARQGQFNAALAHYETCRQVLQTELGVEPAPETRLLQARLLAASQHPAPPLPAPITPLVGRQADVERVQAHLANPDCRLITLTGAGGMGKTRLALHVAHAQASAFINGVYWIPLAAHTTPEALISAIAEAMRFAFAGPKPPADQLSAYVRGKEALLVLDDFDHLLGAKHALVTLLRAAPDLKLLVTARLRLNLHQEWVLEVSGLEVPAAAQADPQETAAVRLFWQAARRVRPDFDLNPANLPHVSRICQLVMGTPLGIELAAAWLRVLAPEEIAAAIAHDLDTLTSASPDVPERHRSFRAVLDHSWGLLTAEERAQFCQLAVLVGGFDFPTAQAVAGTSPTTLSSLVDKSFVQRSASGRYATHELLRHYAAGRAPDCLPPHTRPHEAMARHYLNFAAQRSAALRGPRQPEALEELTAELDNLRASWDWASAARRDDLLAPALEALMSFFDLRGNYEEADRLLARLADWGSALFAAWVLAWRGWVCDRLARYAQGQEFSERAQAMFQTQGDARGQAHALANLGMNAISRGALDEALALLQRGYALSADDEPCQARCLNLMGVIYKQRGDFARARDILSQSLGIFRALGDPQRTASLDNNLGAVLRALDDLEGARLCYAENLAIRRRLGDPRGVALALVNLANLLAQMERLDEARTAYQESLALYSERADTWGKALCLHNLGDLERAHAAHALALRHYQESLALRRRIRDRSGAAYSLAALGHTCTALNDLPQAEVYFREAAELALELQLWPVVFEALGGMALVWAQRGEKDAATALSRFILAQPATERQTRKLLENLPITDTAPLTELTDALTLAFGEANAGASGVAPTQ